jgi:hypothetical protein
MLKQSRVFGALLTLALAAAGCGEPPPPATPPPAEPPPAPTEPAKPAETTAAAPPPAAETAAPAPAAAPKPLKERVIGKWQFELSAESRAYHEASIRKKTGKDEAKFAKAMKEVEEAATKEWIEMTADTYTSYVGDKIEAQMKYEVVKEEGNTLTVKPTRDLVAKKDIKGDMTVPVSLSDDNTLVMFDPKKKINLTFKRKP